MNSYSLGLTGSWILLCVLFVIALVAALAYYRHTIPPIIRSKKNLLISVRTLALWLLLFALFEPVLTLIRSSNEAPKTIVMLDNSRSMTINGPLGIRTKQLDSIFLRTNRFKEIDHNLASFAEKTFLLDTHDSLRYDGENTDISQALRWASSRTREENVRALVMVSDGNFTKGNNPLYDAEQMGLPLYVIGVGDTVEPKDIAVQPIITNEFGYVGKPVPIVVSVKSTGYSNPVDVILLDNNQEIAKQTLPLSMSQNNYSLQFVYTPKEQGTRKLTVKIASQSGELTERNNSSHEFISIIEFKRKIALFAGSPSPDVSFIRRILEQEEGAEITTYIQKQGAQFYDKQPDAASLANTQAIVCIGFPNSLTSSHTLSLIDKELDKGKPLLFISGLTTDYTKAKALEQHLPFTLLSSRAQEFLVTAEIKPSATTSSIFQIPETDNSSDIWNQLPPLYKTETFVKAKPESQILAGAKMNATSLNEPLIIARTSQNNKSIAILGYGLYRWKLLGQAADVSKGKTDVIDFLQVFITNTLQWLTIDNDKKKVSIRTVKKQYAAGERIEFIGQVYDPALSPLDKAYVEVNIQTKKGVKKVILQSIGNGRYTTMAEALPVGDYSFTGSAFVTNELYGQDEGRFSVGDNPAEFQSLTMNKRLLMELAQRTGGKFYYPWEVELLQEDIKKHPQYMSNTIQQSDEIALWNALFILGLSLLSFSLEWFIRTRSRLV